MQFLQQGQPGTRQLGSIQVQRPQPRQPRHMPQPRIGHVALRQVQPLEPRQPPRLGQLAQFRQPGVSHLRPGQVQRPQAGERSQVPQLGIPQVGPRDVNLHHVSPLIHCRQPQCLERLNQRPPLPVHKQPDHPAQRHCRAIQRQPLQPHQRFERCQSRVAQSGPRQVQLPQFDQPTQTRHARVANRRAVQLQPPQPTQPFHKRQPGIVQLRIAD